ncbi:MAG: TatD family hydrolase [Candidatus Heimdallarchaeum endolithica]|uniref:TatD family hydrolase n=1 Tax=Candidatus Heimdallarchaeum endolithica TaxID=2876572 RepID=A0A9Y1BQU4_9ARCH|nr:MAG: TatD family hydrolase [Candidatus Heimdallarchaeum endolithica]
MSDQELIFADAHCHLYPPFFSKKDINGVIQRAKSKNVLIIVNSILNPNHFEFGLSLTKNQVVYLSIGMQPTEVEEEKFKKIEEFLLNNLEFVVAIGEIGLDYYWVKEEEKRKEQKLFFKRLIELAEEKNKPIVIHSRAAETDAIDIIESYNLKNVLMHCFTGTENEIKQVVDNGWFITVPTSLVYRKNFQKILSLIPERQLMFETDSPYHSLKKGEKNEPAAISISAKKAAMLKGIDTKKLADITTENVANFYGIRIIKENS